MRYYCFLKDEELVNASSMDALAKMQEIIWQGNPVPRCKVIYGGLSLTEKNETQPLYNVEEAERQLSGGTYYLICNQNIVAESESKDDVLDIFNSLGSSWLYEYALLYGVEAS